MANPCNCTDCTYRIYSGIKVYNIFCPQCQHSKLTGIELLIDEIEHKRLLNDISTIPDKNIVGDQYKHLKCDTVEWSKANHSLDQQKAICQFMINKYSMRNKSQDKDDIIKIRYYTDWLEVILMDESPSL